MGRTGIIEADPRLIKRSMEAAIQGDIYRSLVELITNSDDSYTRLEDEIGEEIVGKIDVFYKRRRDEACFSVRDYAEGLSIDDFNSNILKWGAATSGMFKNIGVRGYFGRGVKDVLASMEDGRLVSIKDGKITACKLFFKGGKPWYDMLIENEEATEKQRKEHGLSKDGAVAYFTATQEKSGAIPRFDTVYETLSNNYMLRKVMINKNRRIILHEVKESGKQKLCSYVPPTGKEIYGKSFKIDFKNYEPFTINLSIWRSENELKQVGDDRDGGLLVIDEEVAVLDVSLFKYDNEPLANRLYGELQIHGFRKLLQDEEAVLDDKRHGLAKRHSFNKILIQNVEEILKEIVAQEAQRRKGEKAQKRSKEELKRYKSAVNILNKIAGEVINDAVNLSKGGDDYPKNGLCLIPESANISIGKKYSFELKYDTNVIRQGTKLNIVVDEKSILLNAEYISIPKEESDGIHSRNIVVEPKTADVTGTLSVVSGNRKTSAKIVVSGEKPERELLYEQGLLFEPMSVSVRPSKRRNVVLKVYTQIIRSGDVVTLTSDNENIEITPHEIVANEAIADRHIAKYDIEVLGRGIGQDGQISAEYDGGGFAWLDVHVRSKEESDKRKPKGMFSEPEFDPDPEPLSPSSFSKSTGKVIIYSNFPTVRHYLGDKGLYHSTLPAQIMIAEIFCSRCFYEMARVSLERSGLAINPLTLHERIQRDANDLLQQHGETLLKALVNPKLLKESRLN